MADTALIPDEVVIYAADLANPRFTPRELRLVREHVGRSFSAILADEESDEKFLVFGWLKLRRDGCEVDLADMDDVVMTFRVAEAAEVDPTNGRPSATSPPSATTGG